MSEDYKLSTHSEYPCIALRYVANVQGGSTPSSKPANWDGGIPFATPADLGGLDGKPFAEIARSITETGEKESKTIEKGLLVSCRAPVGYVAQVPRLTAFNQGCKGVMTDTEDEARYLAYALVASRDEMEVRANGTTFQEISGHSLGGIRIPFPDEYTRSRIADFLDEETGEIDRVVGVLDELIEDLDVRRSNTIREKMDEARELTIESGIATIPDLGYEAVLIRRGISPAYLEDGDEEPGSSIRVVNQKCIRSGSRIDYSLARRNDLSKKAVNKDLLIRPGDILINSTGTGTLGRTALVREVDEPTTFDSHVTLVRPKSSVDGGFLGYFMLNSEDILVLESRGSTNQIELSQNTVSWLELPLPSLDEQRRIADYLDEETSRIDKMRDTATELREELIARRKAIITEYVTGQKRVG